MVTLRGGTRGEREGQLPLEQRFTAGIGAPSFCYKAEKSSDSVGSPKSAHHKWGVGLNLASLPWALDGLAPALVTLDDA